MDATPPNLLFFSGVLLSAALLLFLAALWLFHKARSLARSLREKPPPFDAALVSITVSDIMVPRSEVSGIDLDADMSHIMHALSHSQHTRLPVYGKDLNHVLGILHLRVVPKLLRMEQPNKAELLQLTRDAYFVPQSTPLTTQLLNFQKHKRSLALVVDEYGDVKGIVTLEDLLEELVNHFTANTHDAMDGIQPQADGSYLIDGGAPLRDINRALGWDLPTDGPKTLNGLLTEHLESIPEARVGLRLPPHCVEILHVKDNLIKTVRMWHPKMAARDGREPQATIHD
ncbi:MAG: CBS domain-containing protein [Pseudomonadales bacterium]|nr:CBS domain-containing protein [Pseudomonadales bacterium]